LEINQGYIMMHGQPVINTGNICASISVYAVVL